MASVAVKIGPHDHGRRMTLDEFGEAEEEPGYRYELARGVLEVSYVPGPIHRFILCNFIMLFKDYYRRHPGRVLCFGEASSFRLWIPEMISGRHPDFSIVPSGTCKDAGGDYPPAIAVEVVSPGTAVRDRDYRTKREEYWAFGISEYWIIDPQTNQVTLLCREEQDWSERLFGKGEGIASRALPGFDAPVDALLTLPPEAEFAQEPIA